MIAAIDLLVTAGGDPLHIMLSRTAHLDLRPVALFVAVAATVAVVTVFVAREAGVGDEPAGAAETPLSLSISAPAVCDVHTQREYLSGRNVLDDQGNILRTEEDSLGWPGREETAVVWSVSGGIAPYTLEIDGLSRDAAGSYAGATGTASVSCVISFAEPTINEDLEMRFYPSQPVAQSGTKTIRAVVTDAGGVTAEASVGIYVTLVVERGDTTVMRGGLTYRLLGRLYTVPQDMSVALTGGELIPFCLPDATNCEGSLSMAACGAGYRAPLTLGMESGTIERWGPIEFDEEDDPSADRPRGSSATDTPSTSEINAKLDQFFASINRLPKVQDALAEVDLSERFDALTRSPGQLPSVERTSP